MSPEIVPVTRNHKSKVVSGVLVAVTIGITTWWVLVDNHSAPRRTRDALAIQPQSSSLVVPVVLSLDDVQRRLNQELPALLASIDENRDSCVPAVWGKTKWPFHIKLKLTPAIDCHLKGQAVRGPITLSGSGQDLVLSMPVAASLTARGRGEIGRRIQETANGAINATAFVRADIDSNWTPSATIRADYAWTNRIGVDILGFRITFADKVDPKLREMIDGLQKRIPDLLAKLAIKDQAAKAWSKAFATLQVSKNPDVWVNFTPEAIGYNGYTIAGRELRFAILAEGRTDTFLGQKPASPVATTLPAMQRDLPQPGLSIVVPVSADYASLAEAARSALNVGKPQVFDIRGRGAVKATFKDVVIHQTEGRRLAIGVTLDTDASVGFLNLTKASGTVWFVADVKVDNQSKKAKIDRLTVHSRTDSAATDLLASIVNLPMVHQALARSLSYDFSEKYKIAIKEAEKGLNRQLEADLRLAGKIDDLQVDSITAGPDALVANVAIKGRVEIRTDKLVN